MFTRISDRFVVLAALALLAGCKERTADPSVLAKVEADQTSAAADEGRINCALAGADTFQRACRVDRGTDTAGRLVLTVHHPDGGFRRLLVTRDGRGVTAADGAQPAKVGIVDAGEIEVAIGNDIYRLPATVKPSASATPSPTPSETARPQ
jgi:hypothetical protein